MRLVKMRFRKNQKFLSQPLFFSHFFRQRKNDKNGHFRYFFSKNSKMAIFLCLLQKIAISNDNPYQNFLKKRHFLAKTAPFFGKKMQS